MVTTPSLAEVAAAYVGFVRQGEHQECLDTPYSADAESVEPSVIEDICESLVTQGIQSIKEKSERFFSYFDIEEINVSEPFLHSDNAFAVTLTYGVRHRGSGEAFDSHEVAVLTVEAGRITREVFYQQP